MANKSTAKGFGFERQFCKDLSLWWSSGDRDDLFWRTSGSGARATTRGLKGQELTKYQHGDVTFIHPDGQLLMDHWNIECKRYQAINVFSVLYDAPPEKSLLAFWAKTCREAEASGRHAVMVTRVDQGKSVIWFRMGLYIDLICLSLAPSCVLAFDVAEQDVVVRRTYPRKRKGQPKKRSGQGKPKVEKYRISSDRVSGVLLEEFFENIPPGRLRSHLELESIEEVTTDA